MDFHEHYNLNGKHAFLSASKYHWINYDDEKLIETFDKWKAVERGTRLHSLASELISLGVRLPRSNKTLDRYVNDAIGYRMTPEQTLFYSYNCFGTADAISFSEKKSMLRIHDLKTGVSPASMNQLLIYSALFFLEYQMKPSDVKTELRIYQSDEITVHSPDADEIVPIMDKIVAFDELIERIKD